MNLALLLLAACATPAATPGWNRVPTADLVPDGSVEWFVVGSPVQVTDSRPVLLTRSEPDGWGRYVFEIQLPGKAEHLTLKFRESLSGAKVDATLIRSGSTQSDLVRAQRIDGAELNLKLPYQAWPTVRIVVHHHFRKPPVLQDLQLEWSGVLSAEHLSALGISARPGELVYRMQPGAPVELCTREGASAHITLTP